MRFRRLLVGGTLLGALTLTAGSTVYLDGGEELTPYFQIGGTSACSTLVATNAVHFTVGASRTTPFRLASGGTLAVREKGAITLEDVESDNKGVRNPWTLSAGALVDVAGEGLFHASNMLADVSSGEVLVRERGTLHVNTRKATVWTVNAAAGDTATLSVRDHAKLVWTCGDWHRFIIGTTAGGRAVVNLDSDGGYDIGTSGYFELGGNVGWGELNLSKGYLYTAGHSPRIGGNGTDSANSGSSAVGILRVTGTGVLDNNPTAQYAIQLNGLVVGRGFDANLANPGWIRGSVYVADQGVVTNRGSGYIIVGAGFSTGEIHQAGGLIYDANTTYQAILGAWGGTGRWVVSNGVSHVRCDTYVGGIFTNQLAGMVLGKHDPDMLAARNRIDCHSATGCLQVVGGRFTCEKTIYVGMDGVGTVGVGPTGELRAETLCLTNVADAAAGTTRPSTLEYVFGPDGVGTVTVTNLTVAEGSKLRIDVGRYVGAEGIFRLLTAKRLRGGFRAEDVTFVGAGAEGACLLTDAEGFSVRILPQPLVWYTMENDSRGNTNVVASTVLTNTASAANAYCGRFVRGSRSTTVEKNLPYATNGFVRPMLLRNGAGGPLRENDLAMCLPSDPEAAGDNLRSAAIRLDDPDGDLNLQTFTLEFFFRTKKWTNWHGLVVKPLDGCTASNRTNTFAIVEQSYNRSQTALFLRYACVTPEGEVVTGSTEVYRGADPTIQDGDWHHLAVSVDGATHVFRLYLDGKLKKTLTLPGDLLHGRTPGVSEWTIGGDPYGDWAWGGVVDEVRLTGRALAADALLRSERVAEWQADSGDWAAAENWSGAVPSADLDAEALRRTDSPIVLTVRGTASAKSLTLGNVATKTVVDVAGGSLTVAGDLTLGRASELRVNGGKVEVQGTLTVEDGSVLSLADGGTLTADRIVFLNGEGEMRFRLGADGGERIFTRFLDLGGEVRLSVDTSAYLGRVRQMEIIDADETEGAFASTAVSGPGALVPRLGGGLRLREPGDPSKCRSFVIFIDGGASRRGPAPPVAPAPFVGTTYARQEPVFLQEPLNVTGYKEAGRIGHTFHEFPRIVYGDKELKFAHPRGTYSESQLYPLSIMRGGVEIGRLFFWGSATEAASGVSGNFGYPFKDVADDPPRLEWDAATKTMRYAKPYIAQDRTKRTFTVTVTPDAASNGLFRVDWDVGVPPEEHATQAGVSPWFSCEETDYRGRTVTFGGVPYEMKDDEALIAAGNDSLRTDVKSCDIAYSPEAPEKGFTLRFDPSVAGYVTESIRLPSASRASKGYSLLLRGTMPGIKKMAGTVWLDLGPAAVYPNRPEPIAGVDFWGTDAIEVSRRPTRNLLPNPSFEQGLRYWRFSLSGRYAPVPRSQERFGLVEEGLFGRQALVVRASQGSAASIQSFPLALQSHQTYTFSFYAKGAAGRKVSFGFQSPGKTGQFASGVNQNYALDGSWRRFSHTFTDDCGGLVLTLSGDDGVLVDGLQLEEGGAATAWTGDPVEGVLRTSDADNDVFLDEEIGASYDVFGPPDAEVRLDFRLQNAFRETAFAKAVTVRLDADGRASVPLALDKARIGEGVFVLRVGYETEGVAPWCDHHRLSAMAPLANTHPTKDLFGTLSTMLDRIGRGDDLSRKFMQWGFGSTSWGTTADMSEERNLFRMMKRYRITDYFRGITSDDKELSDGYMGWTSVSPETEARIERSAYDTVRTNDPYFRVWGFGNEEEDSAWLCTHGEWDEYAKAQLACYRGIKRARPDAIVVPTCGTSAYRPGTKYVAISNYMASALKQGVRYDAIAIHQYGNIDGGLLGEYDMDVHTQHLIDEMNAFGYPASAPIFTTEMFNQLDVYLPQWGATGWGDFYQFGRPGYDFSQREFVQAASAARIWSIALKYWPKLASVNIWIVAPYVDCHLSPLVLCKAANTFGHHFPDVAYHGSVCDDVRRVRAYVYRRPDGRASATLWTNDLEVERGNAVGRTLVLPSVAGLEVYDFMGNRRQPRQADGGVELPLTPAPLILHAASPQELLTALEGAL